MAYPQLGLRPARLDLVIWARDDWTGEVSFVDVDTEEAVDVSDWTAWVATIRRHDTGEAVETLTVDDTDADTGVLGLTLPVADAAALLPAGTLTATWSWDLAGDNADDENRTTHAGLAIVTIDPEHR